MHSRPKIRILNVEKILSTFKTEIISSLQEFTKKCGKQDNVLI